MAKRKSTAVTLKITTSVPDVLEVLNNKLSSLKAITDKPYKTSGNLEGFCNIEKETKIENLIRAFSMVKGRETAYHDSALELGRVNYPAFKMSGGNTADWKQDILLRIAIIEHDETKKKLQDLSDKAKKFLSEKDQYQIFLKEAAAAVENM